ncbi:TolB family protein [Actinoplanes palleronii]|uniref:WD40 repeat protein n=1 Tax=Actinoplanes palleronii TaxID=113570 RepID=A0ABQ4BH02_9ACTN|nr:hypothetical protein [Actinoplanes palleronii]GIE69965.1 hypothetical protein Apa02nite_060730 [Actinoplanes palleronii]
MTEGLRQELRRTADSAPVYPVYERAMATARRTRRRTAAAWAAVAAVLAVAVPVATRPAVIPVAAGQAPSLPDRIGLPAYGSLDVDDRPRLGAAAVSFIGDSRRLGLLSGESELGGLVGAYEERYRTIDVGIASRRAPLLSPDGRFAADEGGLVDLSTGRSTPLALTPLAWSPDGRQIVGSTLGTAPGSVDLVIKEVAGGEFRTLATAGEAGFSVAFSADGDRLAYLADGRVHVLDSAGRELVAFTAPSGYRLAGKGAWTPDGSALALVASAAWAPRWFDPGTGQPVAGPELPAVSGGVVAAGLLGWRPDGSALLYLRREAGQAGQVLALSPRAGAPAQVTAVDPAITDVDLAARAISSGGTRAGDPPFLIGPAVWWWLAGIVLALGALVAGVRWKRRAGQRRG